MRASVGDAAGYSVMVGIGETYFAAFALALGTGETFAGLIATVPMLCGATLQLLTPWAVAQLGSHRRWVVGCVCLQAASLLLMPLAALLAGSSAAAWWVFLAATMYWAAGLSTAPSWNTWIEQIIPKPVRPRYFALRARISQICTLLGFAAGGLALHFGKASGGVLAVFCGILAVAAVCRFASAGFLRLQSESPQGPAQETEAVEPGRVAGATRLIWYLLAMQTAVQISGPYFTPYLLSEEGLSYFSFMVLIGLAFMAKAIASPFWGRVAHVAGARRLLWIGGLAIIPIAGLWIFGDLFDNYDLVLPRTLTGGERLGVNGEFLFLCFVQMLSGTVWAAYELAMVLMFFEAIPRASRTRMLTMYNFGNAAATVAGGLIGATILQLLSETHTAYLIVFLSSSIGRAMTLPVLLRAPAGPKTIVAEALPTSSIEARIPIGPPTLRIDAAAAKPLKEETRSAA
jgi:MFS family permease